LKQWLDKDWLGNAMFYRFNSLIEMSDMEKRLIKNNEIHIDDMACTKWRSMLAYSVGRNVANKLKGEERRHVIDEVLSRMAEWLATYGGGLKIPLWNILYNRR